MPAHRAGLQVPLAAGAPAPQGGVKTVKRQDLPPLPHALHVDADACLVAAHCRWVLWVSLAIMLGDSVTSLTLLVVTSSRTYLRSRRRCELEPPQRRQPDPLLTW